MIVESILAHSKNFVIGKGTGMPWHHSGDFRRFRQITKGHALLMGAKTFFGITEHYKNKSESPVEMLPGRTIFILGSCREEIHTDGHYHVHRRGFGPAWSKLTHQIIDHCLDHGILLNNIRVVLDDDSPENILQRIEPMLLTDQKLFIAGGAKVYREYMRFSSKVYVTVIDKIVPLEEGIVELHPESVELLRSNDWKRRNLEGHETTNELCAFYHSLE